MPVAKPVSSVARVIAHVDMDCFYVQVEQRKQPQLRGLPVAVVQYNGWKGGGLIAVSYEARKHGVKRSMRGDEAKSVCPQIHLVQVPVARGKADLTSYRDAGSEVVSILARKGRCERASIDEVYLDLTDAAETMLAECPPESLDNMYEEVLKSHIFGINEDGFDVKENVRSWLQRSDADQNDKLLSCGALIVTELRKQVLKETEFTCSAGIANNKMLAKLASGLNKPAQQTIVPSDSVKEFLGPWPIKKMKQLGGKLGDSLQSDLGVNTVGELLSFSKIKLQEYYGFNTGTWLWNIARGVSGEEVQGRLLPKSHGSGKTFPGPRALRSIDRVSHWLQQLCEELSERLLADLEQNKRIAHTLTLHVRAYKSSDMDSQKFPSKSCPLRYGALKIQEDASRLFHAGLREYMSTHGAKSDKHQNYGWGVTGLSISASKIVAVPQGTCTIKKFFPSQCPAASQSSDDRYNESMQADMQLSESDCISEGNLYTGTKKSTTMHDISDLYQNEEGKRSQKDQTAGAMTGHLQEQATYCSLKEKATTSYSKELTTSSSLYDQATDAWSILDQSTVHASSQLARKATTSTKIQDQELRNPKAKAKGTPSILTFLKRDEPSSSQSKHQLKGVAEEVDNPIHSGCSMLERDQSAGKCERWSYNVDEIDPTIVEELPVDIQQELSKWFPPLKQSHPGKRTSITSYFLPSKVSRQ